MKLRQQSAISHQHAAKTRLAPAFWEERRKGRFMQDMFQPCKHRRAQGYQQNKTKVLLGAAPSTTYNLLGLNPVLDLEKSRAAMSVFLSHSHRDKSFVRKLANDLQQEGIRVWIDEIELHAGESLSAIESGIAESEYLLIVLSRATSASSWVQKEIQFAWKLGRIKLIPLLLEDVADGWAEELARIAHVDFRREFDYWKALRRLCDDIHGLPKALPLSAKLAARKIKEQCNPAGELFGLSQQGLATVYSLVNQRNWAFADVSDGTSRFWIGEFYDAGTARVQPYAVIDGRVHKLPELFLLGSDPHPVKNSVTVFACGLGNLGDLASEEKQKLDGYRDRFTKIEKRYTRFQPLLLLSPYQDSTEAVLRAIEHPSVRAMLRNRMYELFTLTKLERDKRHQGELIWKISFFDPTLNESVLTVGVDPAPGGAVKYPAMKTELLNVHIFHLSEVEGKFDINMEALPNALERRDWDLGYPWESKAKYRSARDAVRMVERFLGQNAPRPWQLAFLSNTGVVESVVAPGIAGPADCLLHPDGTAGQWVVEVCGEKPKTVFRETAEGCETGYQYDYKRLLVTQHGVSEAADSPQTCTFTVPLSECPLPQDILEAYENALQLALRSATVDYQLLSVAMDRPKGGAQWRFRFYDAEDILQVMCVSGDGSRVLERRNKIP